MNVTPAEAGVQFKDVCSRPHSHGGRLCAGMTDRYQGVELNNILEDIYRTRYYKSIKKRSDHWLLNKESFCEPILRAPG
jgi:hypothetical protein